VRVYVRRSECDADEGMRMGWSREKIPQPPASRDSAMRTTRAIELAPHTPSDKRRTPSNARHSDARIALVTSRSTADERSSLFFDHSRSCHSQPNGTRSNATVHATNGPVNCTEVGLSNLHPSRQLFPALHLLLTHHRGRRDCTCTVRLGCSSDSPSSSPADARHHHRIHGVRGSFFTWSTPAASNRTAHSSRRAAAIAMATNSCQTRHPHSPSMRHASRSSAHGSRARSCVHADGCAAVRGVVFAGREPLKNLLRWSATAHGCSTHESMGCN
jgi:hypothetical protein